MAPKLLSKDGVGVTMKKMVQLPSVYNHLSGAVLLLLDRGCLTSCTLVHFWLCKLVISMTFVPWEQCTGVGD